MEEALEYAECVNDMHEVLHNFQRNNVQTLIEKRDEKNNIVNTKLIFRNKQDEDGQVVRKKTCLVAYTNTII